MTKLYFGFNNFYEMIKLHGSFQDIKIHTNESNITTIRFMQRVSDRYLWLNGYVDFPIFAVYKIEFKNDGTYNILKPTYAPRVNFDWIGISDTMIDNLIKKTIDISNTNYDNFREELIQKMCIKEIPII